MNEYGRPLELASNAVRKLVASATVDEITRAINEINLIDEPIGDDDAQGVLDKINQRFVDAPENETMGSNWQAVNEMSPEDRSDLVQDILYLHHLISSLRYRK